MKINYNIIKTIPAYLGNNFHLIFAKRATAIFVLGAVLSLSVGAWLFYQNSYNLTTQEYDVSLRSRRISSQLLDSALLYVEEQGSAVRVSIERDPFRP